MKAATNLAFAGVDDFIIVLQCIMFVAMVGKNTVKLYTRNQIMMLYLSSFNVGLVR